MKEEEVKVSPEQLFEGGGEVAPKKSTKVPIVALTPKFHEELLAYLKKKPYEEVSYYVDNLKQLNPFEVTLNG